jgi:hypothetical protein
MSVTDDHVRLLQVSCSGVRSSNRLRIKYELDTQSFLGDFKFIGCISMSLRKVESSIKTRRI